MTTPNTQDSMAARKQSTSMKELPNFTLTSSQEIPLDKRPTYSKQVGASTSMENLSAPKHSKANDKEREKIEKEKEKQDKKIEKEREKIAEKLEKEFEKIDKDREKKEGERDKNLERRLEKIEKERDKDEKDKLDGKDMMYAFLGQRTRLHELFGQIEKEFELLWEENADLRRKLEDVRHGYSSNITEKSSTSSAPIVKRVFSENSYGSISSKLEKSRLNPLKKKEKEEWERITNFVGHRDGICDMTTPKWEKHTFMTASADRTARVWSSDSFNPVYIYMGHKGSVNSVRCHPTNRLICTGGGDSSVHVWKLPKPNEKNKEIAVESNVKPWTPLLEKNQSPQEGIVPPEPEPQQQQQQQQQQEGTSGVLMITRSLLEFKHKGPVVAADWVGPGDRIVSASWDRTIKYWTLENGRLMLDFDAGLSEPTAYITNVTAHAVQPLVLTSSSDTYFRLWDIRSPQSLAAAVQAHSDVVTTAVFSPIEENIIVTGSDDRTVKIWDRRNLKVVRNVIRCSGAVNRLALSPLSSQLVIPMDDCRTKVCDLSGKQLGRLKSENKHRHRLMLSTAAWSADESVIFTAGWDKTVIAWAQSQKKVSAN